jgi:hypothetical protein
MDTATNFGAHNYESEMLAINQVSGNCQHLPGEVDLLPLDIPPLITALYILRLPAYTSTYLLLQQCCYYMIRKYGRL